MKFKQDAVARAFYKVLGLFMVLLYIQAAFLVMLAFVSVATQETTMVYVGIGYAVAAAILAGVGEFFRNVRSEMVDK